MTTEFPLFNITSKAEFAYLEKTLLAVVYADQSKAFDTLHTILGQQIPLRRLSVPEKLIKLNETTKRGSWTMVLTAAGVQPEDWEQFTTTYASVMLDGSEEPGCSGARAELRMALDNYNYGGEAEGYGFHPDRGTTQGSKKGPTLYKAYGDWGLASRKALCSEGAPQRGPGGRVLVDQGDVFMDDTTASVTSLEAACAVVRAMGIFFAFMGAQFNLGKTVVQLLEWADNGRFKVHPKEGQPRTAKHLPEHIVICDPLILERAAYNELRIAELERDGDWQELQMARQYQADLRRRLEVKLRVVSPDSGVRYLGVDVTLSLQYKDAQQSARLEMLNTAARMQSSAMEPHEAIRLAKMVPLGRL